MPRLARLLAVPLIAVSVATGTFAGLAGNAAASSTYIVRSGDSLGKIAARLDVPLDDLLRVNRLTVRSVIHPGQQLIVPGPTGSSTGTSGPASGPVYVIRAGDSLGRIAARLGVSLDALLRANGLTVSSLILPGQRLTVPGGGGGGGAAGGGATSGGGASGGSYVIRAGDSLGRIAARLGVSLDALLQANGLTVSSLILPGQRLTVPGGGGGGAAGGGATSGGGASGGSYVIKAGDSLGRIAARLGVSLDALLQANGLTVSSLILPGQRLTVPGGGGGGAAGGGATNGGGSGGGARAGTYVVRPGDYLARIAAEHGVSLNALLAANRMTVTSLILPGQAINIPSGATASPTPSPSPAPTPPPTPTPTPTPAPSGSVSISRVLDYAVAQVGKPWRFFSRGPTHFDCSGLTTAAYAQIGVSLTHQSAWQARQGVAVDFRTQPIRAGDLVFQDTDGDGVINHVGIALNSTTWVQARSSRAGVAVGRIPSASNIVAVRRVIVG